MVLWMDRFSCSTTGIWYSFLFIVHLTSLYNLRETYILLLIYNTGEMPLLWNDCMHNIASYTYVSASLWSDHTTYFITKIRTIAYIAIFPLIFTKRCNILSYSYNCIHSNCLENTNIQGYTYTVHKQTFSRTRDASITTCTHVNIKNNMWLDLQKPI